MLSNEIFVNDEIISTKFIINEKYKFMDVKKIEESFHNNRTYNIYEFVKPFHGFRYK